MPNKIFAALVTAGALSLYGQALNHKIDFPKDSPVSLLSEDFGNSNVTARGANVIDVNAALSLRNSGQKRIRSMTLMVSSPDAAGKGSVSVPTLDAGPGETFSVHIGTRLVRPLTAGNPVVEVTLDGVLFDDLSFYGPDLLHSQRTMIRWELEAQRDRKYFKTVLASAGAEALGKEMILSLARQGDRSQTQHGVQMVRGRATNIDADRETQFAFLDIPESPVEASNGRARIGTSLAGAPQFEVRNRSPRAVQHLEIAWIVKDQQGREFLAASMPADMKLAPNQSGQVAQDAALRFDRPISVQSMSGFVSSVEFADGSQWIPSRGALDQARLHQLVNPSPEEQRLSQIYTKKGLQALIDELKKF
jgi:hypothetical protein